MLLSLLLSTASAAELKTSYPTDSAVNYRIQMGFQIGTPIQIYARNEIDATLFDMTALLLVACTGEEPGKRSQEVNCVIERALLMGHGKEREQAEVDAILAEYAASLGGGTIQLGFTSTGRIKTVDLEGVPKDSPKAADAHEFLREQIARGVGVLDMEMPKDGVDPGKAWKQKVFVGIRHPEGAASGSVKAENRVASEADGAVVLEQTGAGVLETLHSVENGLGQRMTITLNTTATFDDALHIVVQGEQRVVGEWSR